MSRIIIIALLLVGMLGCQPVNRTRKVYKNAQGQYYYVDNGYIYYYLLSSDRAPTTVDGSGWDSGAPISSADASAMTMDSVGSIDVSVSTDSFGGISVDSSDSIGGDSGGDSGGGGGDPE